VGEFECIGEQIKEYFETGKIQQYENLKEKYSEDLIKFIRISGLGRRRIFYIYEAIGAKTLSDLKEAISDGSIYRRTINGPMPGDLIINKIHIERFIYSLEYYESTKKLFPSGYAPFFLENINSGLLGLKDIRKIQVTGSLRRKKSFIKDIDILVLPVFNNGGYDFALSENLLKQIARLGFVKKIISLDKRDSSISARYGTVFDIEIEVIISSRAGWSYDLFTTTGSKAHVAEINKLLNLKNASSNPVANDALHSAEIIGKEKINIYSGQKTGIGFNASDNDLQKTQDCPSSLMQKI